MAAEADETTSDPGQRKKSFRLVVDEAEMQTVRFIFREYLEKQSLVGIVRYFLSHSIRTKRGKEYTTTAVRDILTNPVYCTADKEAYEYFWNLGCQVCMEEKEADGTYGLIAYAKTSSAQYKNKSNLPEKWSVAIGRHPGIISGKDFSKIQRILAKNNLKGESYHKVRNPVSLLSGILCCSCGHWMRPKNYSVQQVTEAGERRFSYLCPYKAMTHGEKCSTANVQGNRLDELVCKEVLRCTQEKFDIRFMLQKAIAEIGEMKQENTAAPGLLEQEIQKRKKEIRNLIHVLAESEGDRTFIKQIEEEILKLKEECEELERAECLEKQSDVQGGRAQIELLREQFSSFDNLFDTLSVPEKREYLRMVLDRVVWDGKEAHVFIKGGY